MKTTTIKVSYETWQKLKELKRSLESFDALINRLIRGYEFFSYCYSRKKNEIIRKIKQNMNVMLYEFDLPVQMHKLIEDALKAKVITEDEAELLKVIAEDDLLRYIFGALLYAD